MRSCQPSPSLACRFALVGLIAALSACKSEQGQAPPPQAAPPVPVAEAPAATPAPRAPAVEPLAKPFFWEVRRNGAVSHLLGTIHAKYQLAHQPPAVTERLDAAEIVVIEADVTSLSVMNVLQQAMLPPEQSLRVMLGDEHWRKLVGAVGKVMPAPALERMQPWFAILLVSLGDLVSTDQSQVMDMQIFQRAGKGGTRVVFLEEASEQLKLLSESGDLDTLKEMLDELDEVRTKLNDMLAAYGRGDFEALSASTLDPEEMRERPEFYEKLLFQRNRAWLRVLQPLLNEGGVFVAVGAGHFVGEQGLLSLLRTAGYEIRRVEP
jgi:uncharacterized protein YbaP (TraB family)